MVFTQLVNVLYGYDSQGGEEHSIAVGEKFLVLDRQSSNDWLSGVRYIPGHENLKGDVKLLPASYVEEVPAIGSAIVQHAYEHINWDELDLESGIRLTIYDDRDTQWWVAAFEGSKDIGLVPSSYLSDYAKFDSKGIKDPIVDELTAEDRSESFVCSEITRSVSNGDGSLLNQEISDPRWDYSFLVIDHTGPDKNFKKERFLSFDSGAIHLSESTPDRSEVESWKYSNISHFSIKKNEHLILEAGDYSRTFKITRSHANKIKKLIENGILASKSASITAPPPSSEKSTAEAPVNPQIPLVAVATRKYVATSNDCVSINTGEHVTIIDKSNPEKWLVNHISRISGPGYVPSSALEILDISHSVKKESTGKMEAPVSPPLKYERPTTSQPTIPEKKKEKLNSIEPAPPQTRPNEVHSSPNQEMPPRPVAKMESGTRLAASPPKDTLRPVLDQINSMSLKIPSQDPSPTSPCPLTARQPPKKSPDPKAGQRRPQKSNVTQPPPLQGQRPTPVAQKPKVIPGSPVLSEQSSPRQQAKKEDCSKSLASGYRIWADISGTFSTVAKLLEVQPNIEKILLLKKNGVKISVPIRKLSAKDKAYLETISWGSSGSKAKPAKAAPSSINKTSRQSQTSPKSRTNFDWVEFFLNTGVSRGSSEKYASKIKRCLPAEFDASKLSYRVLKNVLEANDSDILRILNILEADNSTPEDPGSVTSGASPKLKQQPTASEPLLSASPPALHKTLKSETAPHPFASHSPKHAGLQSSSAEGGSIPSEMPDPDALARRNEMINDLKKKRIDTEEALRLAQKTLSQAQDEVLKASLIREESKKVRAEVALNRARETAKQALVMSIQAKENYLKSVRDASSQRQQMQVPHSGTTGTGLASQIPLISSTPQISQLPSTSQLNFRVSQFPSVIPQIPQVPQIPQIPQASHIPQTIHQLPFQHQTPQNFLTSHHLPVPEITPVPTLSSPSNFPPLSAIQPSNVLIPTHINQPLPQPHYSYGQPSQFGQQHRNIISAGPDPLYQTHSTGSGMTIGQIPMNMGQPGSYSAQGAPTAFSDINPSLATTPGKYQNPNASGSYLLNHPHSYPYPPAQDRYTSQPNPYSASAVGTLSNGNHSNVASVTTLQSYHTTTNTSFAGHGPMLGRHDYPNVGPILQPGPNANPTAGQPHPNYTH